MKRIIYSLSRPSFLGLYLKDHIIIPLIHILVFFGMLIALVATSVYKSNDFIDLPRDIRVYIENNITDTGIEFDGNTLSGKEILIKGDNLYIYFNKSDLAISYSERMVFNYKEEYVDIYYETYKGRVKYADNELKEFKIDELKDNINYQFNIEKLFKVTLDNVENYYKGTSLPAVLFSSFIQYIIVLGIMLFISFFVNRPIDLKYRIVLLLYDSIIYLFFNVLYLLFALDFIVYIGVFFAFLYVYRTFSRIIKVTPGVDSNEAKR